jgi:hypothetical protein
MLAMFDARALCWIDRKFRDFARLAIVPLKRLSVGILGFPPMINCVAKYFPNLKQNLYQKTDDRSQMTEMFEFGIGNAECGIEKG